MKKAGFTLIELQASLLLTLLTLGSLFLFSFYFWQNHLAQTNYLRFQRETNLFFDWHDRQMKAVVAVSHQGEQVVFTRGNGATVSWRLSEDGPVVHDLTLFSEPVRVTLDYRQEGSAWHVVLLVEEPRLKLKRRWEAVYYPNPWADVAVLL